MNLNHRPSLSMAALSAGLLLSANFSPASAKGHAAFSDYTGADPLRAKLNGTYSGDDSSDPGAPKDEIGAKSPADGSDPQQQAQTGVAPQLDAAPVGSPAAGTDQPQST